MASQFAPMEIAVTPVRHKRLVYVSVRHDVAQSLSRAVTPRAKREFKAWVSENIMFGELALEVVEHSIWSNSGRTTSVYTFSY